LPQYQNCLASPTAFDYVVVVKNTNPKSVVRSIRLSPALLARLEKIAEEKRWSVSFLLTVAAEELADKYGKKK
jgi:predicted DNA-binding ribbon-helix-helix protein